MSSHSAAYSKLITRLEEVWHLYRLCRTYNHIKLTIRPEKAGHVNALTRSAIVLLSSHIQGFVEDYADQVVERLVSDRVERSRLPDRIVYYAAHDAFEDLRKVTDPDKVVGVLKALNNKHGDLLSEAGQISQSLLGGRYKDGFGNPTVSEIKKFLGRFGYENYKQDMQRKLKRDYLIVTNAVDNVVHQRTKIAHGDPIATTTPSDLRSHIMLCSKFCLNTDILANRYFRGIGCRL